MNDISSKRQLTDTDDTVSDVNNSVPELQKVAVADLLSTHILQRLGTKINVRHQ